MTRLRNLIGLLSLPSCLPGCLKVGRLLAFLESSSFQHQGSHGAGQVTACEVFAPMAAAARQAINENGFQDIIQVVPMRSDELIVGLYLNLADQFEHCLADQLRGHRPMSFQFRRAKGRKGTVISSCCRNSSAQKSRCHCD